MRDGLLLANYICVESVWGSNNIQVFAFHLYTHSGICIGEVTDSDDDLLTVTEYDDGSLTVFTSSVGYRLGALGDELTEMLIGIILGGVALLACLARAFCVQPQVDWPLSARMKFQL